MSMDHDQLTEILKYYRSYEYVAINCGSNDYIPLPLVISERIKDPNQWDRTRYSRLVSLIKGAVDHILSDDERTVINRKYLERNRMTLSQISDILHKDRTTIGRWHTEALQKLAKALEPLSEDMLEITPFEHRFDKKWKFKEPKESA